MAEYSEYKDSGIPWIGKIPSHWITRRAKFVFDRHKRPVRPNDEIVTCFRDGVVTLRKNRRESGFTNALMEFGYQGIRKGDLIVHQMDAFAGSIGVSDSDGKSTPVYTVCTMRNGDSITWYYAYLLRVMAKTDFIQSLSRGIRERSTAFGYDIMGNLLLPIPPKEEQEAIVAYLDKVTADIDKAIAAKERIIASLEERRKIIITHAVTRGINPDAQMKDSGIDWLGEIPAHWDIRKLKSIAEIKGRIGFRGYTNEDMVLKGEGAITLSPSNVNNGRVEFEKCSYLSWPKFYESPEIMVENGHLLFVKTGSSYGKTGIVNALPEKATINPQFSLIKPKNILSEFLNYAFATPYLKYQVEGGVIGSTIPTISQAKIRNFIILSPPLIEQEAILDYLERELSPLDLSINQQKRLIDLLRERKNIIINETVTGKVKVI